VFDYFLLYASSFEIQSIKLIIIEEGCWLEIILMNSSQWLKLLQSRLLLNVELRYYRRIYLCV